LGTALAGMAIANPTRPALTLRRRRWCMGAT
jgi:hypothetical protein